MSSVLLVILITLRGFNFLFDAFLGLSLIASQCNLYDCQRCVSVLRLTANDAKSVSALPVSSEELMAQYIPSRFDHFDVVLRGRPSYLVHSGIPERHVLAQI